MPQLTRSAFLFGIIAIFSVIILGARAAEASMLSLSPASGSYAVGQTITVSVLLDTEGAAVDGVDIKDLHYDPAILSVQDENAGVAGVEIAPGALMPQTLANSVDTSAGTVSFSQVANGGTTYASAGPQTLATIRFNVLAAGTSTLSFDALPGNTADTNVSSGGSDILSSASGASFTLTPRSTAFTLGQDVQVAPGPVNVRSTPNGAILGTQQTANAGAVIAGPVQADNLWWWQIDYDTGADGWSAENYLLPSTSVLPEFGGIDLNQPMGMRI